MVTDGFALRVVLSSMGESVSTLPSLFAVSISTQVDSTPANTRSHTWGLNSSYAVFLAYYLANDLFPGASRLEYAFIGGLSISQALVVSPVATLTTRLFGTRTTLLIGVFFETLSFIGASFATKIWHLFLTQGVCFGWGMGFLFVGSVVIAPQWFTTRRSLANGISAAGSGIGGLIYSLAAQAMIRNMSLPWAFRILAIIAFVVNTACSLLIKDRNKEIGSSQLSFDYRLFRKMPFLGLLGFGVLSMLGYVVLLFSLPNYARTVGMTASQGSIIGAVLNLGQALGRPPIGYFSDTFGRLNMAASMTALCGVLVLLVWSFAHSFGVLVFFAIAGGCVAGTFWAVVSRYARDVGNEENNDKQIPAVTAEVMGLVDLPSALSITWIVLVLPTTCKCVPYRLCAHAVADMRNSLGGDWAGDCKLQRRKLHGGDPVHRVHVPGGCGGAMAGAGVENRRAGGEGCGGACGRAARGCGDRGDYRQPG